MTKQQAIQAMREGKKVTHTYFEPDEYVMMDGSLDGEIYRTEDGCEISEADFWALRTQPHWENGWEIYTKG